MHVQPTAKTTKFGTVLTFKVHDLRGIHGFPDNQDGLVFEYVEDREIKDKYTGIPFMRHARYVIRTDDTSNEGWRIDQLSMTTIRGPVEAVYGVDRKAYWPTNKEAAEALSTLMDEIRDNSTCC